VAHRQALEPRSPRPRPATCLCLHHTCNERVEPRSDGCLAFRCSTCEAGLCKMPEPSRVPPPPPRCSACGCPWHPSCGHLARDGRRYCGACTRDLIAAIKQYDWDRQPKGLRAASATLRWQRIVIARPRQYVARP